MTRQCLGCFALEIPKDDVVTSDGEGSAMNSETVNRVVEAGISQHLVLSLSEMEDVNTPSLSADVEAVILTPAQTQHLP